MDKIKIPGFNIEYQQSDQGNQLAEFDIEKGSIKELGTASFISICGSPSVMQF